MGTFYEGLDLMVRRLLVDADVVFNLIVIERMWEHMKPSCLEARKRLGPVMWYHFEYAAEQERSYETKKKRKGV